jgi:hypothetical protein
LYVLGKERAVEQELEVGQAQEAAAEPEVEELATVDPEDVAAVRELIQRAYPDTVAELLTGATVGELMAAVPAAQAAYRRVAAQLRVAPPEQVPAGGGVRGPGLDPETLSPALKIREGLRRAG